MRPGRAVVRHAAALFRSAATSVSVLLGLAVAAPGQLPFQWTPYQSPQLTTDGFGTALCAHDFNNDGFDDLLTTEPWANIEGEPQAGRVWILYGPTFTSWLVFHADPPVNGELLGLTNVSLLSSAEACAVGDVNGDGTADVLVAAPTYSDKVLDLDLTGRAVLFYGPDFSEQVVFHNPRPEKHAEFGSSVLLVDLTRDGKDDVLIGAHNAVVQNPGPIAKAGKVYFWNAADLSKSVVIGTPEPISDGKFGYSLSCALMDSDDVPDVLVGADNYLVPGVSLGRLYVFSGAELELMQTIPAPNAYFARMSDVAFAGDLTGDGVQDLVAQAYGATASCMSPTCDEDGAGQVGILRGPDFQSLEQVFESPKACTTCDLFFGLDTEVADIDQDGSQDVIVGDGGAQGLWNFRTYIYYGPDHGTMQTLGDDGPGQFQGFGSELALGDFDADGWLELVVQATGFSAGTIFLYDVQTLTADSAAFSLGTGGDLTFNFNAGTAQAGDNYIGLLSISGSAPGVIPEPGVFVPLNVDSVTLAALPLVGSPILPGFAGVLDGEGKASFALHLAPGAAPSLVGQTLTVAAVTLESDGHLGIGSSAVSIALQP